MAFKVHGDLESERPTFPKKGFHFGFFKTRMIPIFPILPNLLFLGFLLFWIFFSLINRLCLVWEGSFVFL